MAASKQNSPPIPSALIKKRITFRMSGTTVACDVSQSLFSSHDIDHGTKRLLNSLRKNPSIAFDSILDLGCGYGVMGLFLKAEDPKRTIHLTDRDMLAVRFTQHNAEQNELFVHAYASLDFQAVTDTFNLIVVNFPAKLERQGLALFLAGASMRLKPGGVLAMVVVKELLAEVEAVLNRPEVMVSFREEKSGHLVYHLLFHEPLTPPEVAYERADLRHPALPQHLLRTVRGLPEFDTLSYATQALLEQFKTRRPEGKILMLEPGQGHGAVGAISIANPNSLNLWSRDLLSLESAAANAAKSGAAKSGTAKVESKAVAFIEQLPPVDTVIYHLRDKHDTVLHEWNLSRCHEQCRSNNASLTVYGESRYLKRLTERSNLRLREEGSCRGYSAAVVIGST